LDCFVRVYHIFGPTLYILAHWSEGLGAFFQNFSGLSLLQAAEYPLAAILECFLLGSMVRLAPITAIF